MNKNTLKEYFRSGSRPTQEQFYALIDSCYKGDPVLYVSGYDIRWEAGRDRPPQSVIYEGGYTRIVPWFRRINVPDIRTYSYAIPGQGGGGSFNLHKIALNFSLPESGTYEVKDKSSTVEIRQEIAVSSLSVYNGRELIHELKQGQIPEGKTREMNLDLHLDPFVGINIDITVSYDIASKIAVSDQFDLARDYPEKLEHAFGEVGCYMTI